MPASLPHLLFCPPSRPTFLHFPTIYWRNWHPPLPQKERGKKEKASVTWHFITLPSKHTSHVWVCRQQKAPLRQQVGDPLPHVFRFRSVMAERRGIMFTWCFLSVVLDSGCYTSYYTQHCRGPVSLQSCITPSGHSGHFPSVLPGLSNQLPKPLWAQSRAGGWHEMWNVRLNTFLSVYFLTQTGWRLRRAKENSCQQLWSKKTPFIRVNKERLDKNSRLDLLQGHHSCDRLCMIWLLQGS